MSERGPTLDVRLASRKVGLTPARYSGLRVKALTKFPDHKKQRRPGIFPIYKKKLLVASSQRKSEPRQHHQRERNSSAESRRGSTKAARTCSSRVSVEAGVAPPVDNLRVQARARYRARRILRGDRAVRHTLVSRWL